MYALSESSATVLDRIHRSLEPSPEIHSNYW